MKLVYLAHPVGGDTLANLSRARRWLTWTYRHFGGVAPIAPWIVDCEGVLDEASPSDRARGLATGMAVLARCDEVWLVGGRVSVGMLMESDAARAAGVRVVDLTSLGAEPPVSAQAAVDILVGMPLDDDTAGPGDLP